MKAIGDYEAVSLATGERSQRIAGEGESLLRREFVMGPKQQDPSVDQIREHAQRILKDARGIGHNMNATRCKVRLVAISGGYYGTDKGRTVEFRAVSDGSEENKKFFQATPSFECKFSVSEAAAKSLGLDAGKIGSEFYVDFTPVQSG